MGARLFLDRLRFVDETPRPSGGDMAVTSCELRPPAPTCVSAGGWKGVLRGARLGSRPVER